MGPSSIRDERGFTLIELLIAIGLLVVIAGLFYALIITTDRGWSLLQGQLDTQQNSRVATDRLINDLQEATDLAVSGGTLTARKITILTCPAAAGDTRIFVENAADIPFPSTVTLAALATTTPATITGTGAGTCANGGTSLTLSAPLPASLTYAFPYGTIVFPIPVTYSLSGTQILRAGAALSDNAGGVTFAQHATTLASAATAGDATITVANTVADTCDFAIGDLVYVESEIRAVLLSPTCAGPAAILTLDQPLFFSHALGSPVGKKLAATQITSRLTQPPIGGGQTQQIILSSEGAPRNPPLK